MNFRVGVVEDNREACEQLCGFIDEYGKLRGYNFSVSCFADALDFLEQFREIGRAHV